MRINLFFLAASLAWAQFPTDSRGIIQTGLPAAQDNLLGPLVPYGASPWIFGDYAEKNVADSMAPAALTYVPALGTALSGTFSWVNGNSYITTTADQTAVLSGGMWFVVTWTTVDGAGTGRMLCSINSVTSTQVNCGDGSWNQPTTSGAAGYLLPAPTIINGIGFDFSQWTPGCPSTVWNYYDVAIALYRLYYRTGNTQYQTWARQYADIEWQWVLDHGYRIEVCPRSSTMLSQFFRALDGHPERLPYLYNWIALEEPRWNPSGSPNVDNREAGYMFWAAALGAKVDPYTNTARHTQYCSWLTTYGPEWESAQAADGSLPEEAFALNQGFVSAPLAFTYPPQYMAAPWREAINVKAFEAAIESLNDTSSQGCNDPTLAASLLTTLENLVIWQHSYGVSNRGMAYEVSSQSADENTVVHPDGPTATVAINLASTALTGTNSLWQTKGYCDGTHFIGFDSSYTVYKIASCTSDTAAMLSVAFGLYDEASNISGSTYSIAPAASTSCSTSSAAFCFDPGDRNLTRTTCGGIGWLYAQTHNTTWLNWADECVSATLGGPTAGLTTAVNIGSITLPCSGPACDGYVNDMVTAAYACGAVGGVPPCVYGGVGPFSGNTGKNYGEAFGAPGIDNELAWRNWFNASAVSAKGVMSGKAVH